MKKIILLTSFASLLFVNCSKDDGNDDENGIDVAQNTTEESIIELSTLENGISIEDSTIETGTITPNEQTTFSINQTEQSGFQDVGFEIELNVPENYAGAYLQLVAEDGTAAESYYNITGSSYSNKQLNTTNNTSLFSKKTSNLSAKSLVDEEEVTTIEVDFDETIPAGSFCYLLCIYDTEGNISAPQTLCVEVEAWGGNDAIVGNWSFTKLVATEYGKTYTQNVNEKSCEDSRTKNCYDDNGVLINEVEVNECEIINSLLLNINSDGSQSYSIESEDEELDYKKFNEDCTVEYDLFRSDNNFSGNWAYDEEEQKLTIVDYVSNRMETLNGEVVNDEYDDFDDEIGVGFDLYVTEVTSNQLIAEFRDTDTEFDSETGNTIETEYVIAYYFSK